MLESLFNLIDGILHAVILGSFWLIFAALCVLALCVFAYMCQEVWAPVAALLRLAADALRRSSPPAH